MVTLESNGITVVVPENEASFYTRAGYKKVEEVAEMPPQETKSERKPKADAKKEDEK